MIIAYLCVCKSRHIEIQGIYKSIKFQKYIYGVRVLLGYSASGTGIKGDQIFR